MQNCLRPCRGSVVAEWTMHSERQTHRHNNDYYFASSKSLFFALRCWFTQRVAPAVARKTGFRGGHLGTFASDRSLVASGASYRANPAAPQTRAPRVRLCSVAQVAGKICLGAIACYSSGGSLQSVRNKQLYCLPSLNRSLGMLESR